VLSHGIPLPRLGRYTPIQRTGWFREAMDKLFQQPGVTELGRHGVDEVARAKCAAGFHLYFSKSEAETDCISIRESTVSGCKISICPSLF
jgi:hypothetical protein